MLEIVINYRSVPKSFELVNTHKTDFIECTTALFFIKMLRLWCRTMEQSYEHLIKQRVLIAILKRQRHRERHAFSEHYEVVDYLRYLMTALL